MRFAKKINQKVYYGWVIVFLSGLIFFFSSPGQTYSISVFIDTMPYEVSQTRVSLLYSVATLLSGFSLVFMGRLIDKLGHKILTLVVAFLLAITLVINSFTSSFVLFGLSFFFLRFFGQGSMTLIPSSLVPQWFDKQKATALSLATMGGLIATLVVPSLNVLMIQSYGWETAWRVWAGLLTVFFIPVMFFTLVNKPKDLGLIIENKENQDLSTLKEASKQTKKESIPLKKALKQKNFWILGTVSAIPSMFTTGLTFHIYQIMRLRNVLETEAAFIIGLLALPAILMPLFAKLLIDKFPLKSTIIFSLGGIMIAMLSLNVIEGFVSAVIFMINYGLVIALLQLALNVSWPHYFGRFYLGSIRGGATVFMVIGSALGPLPFGLSYDLTKSYQPVIFGMFGFTLIIFIFSLFLGHKISKKD